MSAYCEWELDMFGENALKLLPKIERVLYRIEQVTKQQGESIFDVYFHKDDITGNLEPSIYTSNSKAKYIWGFNYLDPDDREYIRIAKAAPEAKWKVLSERQYEGGWDGCISYLEAEYSNGILMIRRECFVDKRFIPELVVRMKRETGSNDNSFAAFCRFYDVDDSISEAVYNMYNEANEEDEDLQLGDCYIFNSKTNTVRSKHLWDEKTIMI